MRLLRALVGAAVTAGVLVSSGSAAPAAEVTMPGKFYSPGQLDVLVGTTVTWRNIDRSTHTVTEDDDAFDSGYLGPGQTFSRPFDKSGTYRFHCSIHRFMRGSISVFDVVLRGPPEPVLAGRRTALRGIAPAGTDEVVLERVAPGPVTIVGRAEPGDDGSFTFPLRAPEPRSYRARAGTASSAVVTIRVEPRVHAARADGAIVARALPSRAGSPVVLADLRSRALRLGDCRSREARWNLSRRDPVPARDARARPCGRARTPWLERRRQSASRRGAALAAQRARRRRAPIAFRSDGR